jgi:sarcosine oxidase subunit gamma
MSPDEYLLILPYGETGAALAAIGAALKGQHYLAETVSDARAVFRIEGAKADQVLAKLSPVDFAKLEAGEPRRTRAAQVAAAFWKDGEGFTLVCFRSVASYMMGLLSHSAMPGSELV